ncbi:MAG: tetratricopeptide repeat protein [Cyanobacteria bacterium P01_H01_bin.15]
MEAEIEQLLADLKIDDASQREHATQRLWELWFNQKGLVGLEQLQRAERFVQSGEFAQAETLLTELVAELPDFAEAWNRRAVLYYVRKNFLKSAADCRQVVDLNRYHFGAWHGLGLCEANLGNYRAAIAAFREALNIQPFALINQKLMLECTSKLS